MRQFLKVLLTQDFFLKLVWKWGNCMNFRLQLRSNFRFIVEAVQIFHTVHGFGFHYKAQQRATCHCLEREKPTIWPRQVIKSAEISWSTMCMPTVFLSYRRIPKVTAPVTFGFSRQKVPLLTGSRYFRMVKKRSYSNSRFRQSGRAT